MDNNVALTHLFLLNKACASSTAEQREAADYYGNTALLKACYLGNFEAVRVLMSYKVNIRAINYFGQNALTLATYSGSKATVRELLKYRSYIDFTLSSIIPPLCVAMLRGHRDLVKIFQEIHPEDQYSVFTAHGVSAGDLHNMQVVQKYGGSNSC